MAVSSARARYVALASLALALLASYAYFYQGGGWNQNSRFALIDALIDQHSLRIDPYHRHTGDLAVWRGHYYSDKAPGDVFTALPAVWIAGGLARAAGIDPDSYRGTTFRSYLATVATEGLGALLAALAVWRIARRWGADDGGAAFAMLAFGLATPAWCYATLMFGHALAAGSLALAFAAAVGLGGAEAPGTQWRGALAVGLAAGWATVAEFPAAVPAAALALLALWEAWPHGVVARRRVTLGVATGAVACAALLVAYNQAAFGSPWHIGYESEQNFPGMQSGFFGITRPSAVALWGILFGRYRGLLPVAPIVAAAPFALARLWRRRPDARKGLAAAAFIAVYYVLLNASYRYWDGGWAFGPRHLVPALPFLCLGFGLAWTEGRRLARIGLAGLWIWGAAVSLVAVSTNPEPPDLYKRPVSELLLPAFLHGQLAINHQSFLDAGEPAPLLDPSVRYFAWNLGELAGLKGLASLLPLAGAWVLAAGIWVRALRRPGAAPERPPDATAAPAAALVVVPTYNERDNLPGLVRALLDLPGVHLLIVDDGSPDGTGDLADELAAAHPGRLEVLHRSGPRGLGLAYRDGLTRALETRVPLIVQMDADLSHAPAGLPALAAATARSDLVVGSRYCAGGRIENWSLPRRILSAGANAYVRAVTGLEVRDCTSGYRCWRREALARLSLDRIESRGYAFLVETLHQATRKGLDVSEVPIVFVDRRSGDSKLSVDVLLESILVPWRVRIRPGGRARTSAPPVVPGNPLGAARG